MVEYTPTKKGTLTRSPVSAPALLGGGGAPGGDAPGWEVGQIDDLEGLLASLRDVPPADWPVFTYPQLGGMTSQDRGKAVQYLLTLQREGRLDAAGTDWLRRHNLPTTADRVQSDYQRAMPGVMAGGPTGATYGAPPRGEATGTAEREINKAIANALKRLGEGGGGGADVAAQARAGAQPMLPGLGIPARAGGRTGIGGAERVRRPMSRAELQRLNYGSGQTTAMAEAIALARRPAMSPEELRLQTLIRQLTGGGGQGFRPIRARDVEPDLIDLMETTAGEWVDPMGAGEQRASLHPGLGRAETEILRRGMEPVEISPEIEALISGTLGRLDERLAAMPGIEADLGAYREAALADIRQESVIPGMERLDPYRQAALRDIQQVSAIPGLGDYDRRLQEQEDAIDSWMSREVARINQQFPAGGMRDQAIRQVREQAATQRIQAQQQWQAGKIEAERAIREGRRATATSRELAMTGLETGVREARRATATGREIDIQELLRGQTAEAAQIGQLIALLNELQQYPGREGISRAITGARGAEAVRAGRTPTLALPPVATGERRAQTGFETGQELQKVGVLTDYTTRAQALEQQKFQDIMTARKFGNTLPLETAAVPGLTSVYPRRLSGRTPRLFG